MAQKDPNTETSTTSSVMNFSPMELAEMGKQRLEATIAAQTELFNKLHLGRRYRAGAYPDSLPARDGARRRGWRRSPRQRAS
jgi:hypothetical protein